MFELLVYVLLIFLGGVADPSDHCVNTFQRYSPIDDFWEQVRR